MGKPRSKMTEEVTMEKLLVFVDNVDNIPGIENCSKSKMYLRQWVTSINFFLAVMSIGMSFGHTAILLAQIKLPVDSMNQTFLIEYGEIFRATPIVVQSEKLQSWIVSIVVLFTCPGCWMLAISSKRMGRKPILIITTTLFTIGWFLVVFANSVNSLIIGRAVMGLSIGLVAGLTSVYQGECSIPKLRPIMNAMQGVSFSIGILLVHAVGTWFHWRTTAFFCGVISVISLCLNFYIPESPIWLLNKNRFADAINSWTFLRGTRDFDELKSMFVQESHEDKMSANKQGKKNYFSPAFLKPFGILIVLFSTSQLSGVGAVTFYCMEMIKSIAGDNAAYITAATLILDLFRLTSSVGLSLCSTRYSTRALTLFSSFASSFFLIFLASSILLDIAGPWFSLLLLFGYEASVVLGLTALPWNFLSELFPSPYKEVGVGIITNYYYFMFFVIVKVNLHLFNVLQPWGTFFVYGFLTFTGSIVIYLILPDTRNKSLKEIELMFAGVQRK